MNVLILGGDGFIGSHLAKRHVDLGDTVTVVDIVNLRTSTDSPDYQYIHCDLSKDAQDTRNLIASTSPDMVYNCVAVATPSYYVKYPIDTFDLDFTVSYENICKPLIEAGVPFVQFSTSEVYGKKWISPFVEDTSDLVLGPTHKSRWVYATSKILLEQLLLAHNANCCIIRPQNFIGWDMDWLPGMDGNEDKTWIPRLPACFLNALQSDQPLTVVSPGYQKRCYTYIDDAIDGILAVVDHWDACTGQVLNIGNPDNEVTVAHMAVIYLQMWHELTGRSGQSVVYRDGVDVYGEGYEDCERRMFSLEKMTRLTQWTPKVSLKDTVRLTLENAIEGYKL